MFQALGIPNLSSSFGTAPGMWNLLFGAMKAVPKRILGKNPRFIINVLIFCLLREGDPKGWPTPLIIALGSWENTVPRGHLFILIIILVIILIFIIILVLILITSR
jgi:hypothetical protein